MPLSMQLGWPLAQRQIQMHGLSCTCILLGILWCLHCQQMKEDPDRAGVPSIVRFTALATHPPCFFSQHCWRLTERDRVNLLETTLGINWGRNRIKKQKTEPNEKIQTTERTPLSLPHPYPPFQNWKKTFSKSLTLLFFKTSSKSLWEILDSFRFSSELSREYRNSLRESCLGKYCSKKRRGNIVNDSCLTLGCDRDEHKMLCRPLN